MAPKILKYNVFHFPNDLMKFAQSRSFLMLSLGLLYYGGSAIIIYGTINVQFPWPIAIWLFATFVSVLLTMEFPGLFYLDDIDSRDHMISLLILGPINLLRAVCLAIVFVNQVGETYHYTFYKLWKRHPETWSLDDPWIKAIQRSREIGINTLVGDIRRILYAIGRGLRKIAGIRISGRMVLHLFYIALTTLVFLSIGTAIWLGVTGKL